MTTEKFHYEIAGKKVTLTRLRLLPFGVIRRLRKEDETEQTIGLIEAAADAASLKVIDTLTPDAFNALFAAWQKDSEVSPGESSASAT